jgi:hypothetical protein
MYPYSSSQFVNILPIAVNSYGLPGDDRKDAILKTIAENPKDKLLVFDKSDGPVDNELEYVDWIEDLCPGRDYVLVTANYRYHFDKHPKIVHWPRYFFTMLNDVNTRIPDIVNPRPHKISCLNRNPWLHKSLNLLAMRRQPWFDQVQLSFGVYYPELLPSAISGDLLQMISAEEAEYIESIYPMPLKSDQKDDVGKFESNACPTYQSCYIDYAPESRFDQVFISEKTWKPIFSGQFFFILGPCGIIDYLKDIGIDTFDDLIDHSYDGESDLTTKISMLMSSIGKFLANDLDQLWADTLLRRQKNLDLVYNPDFQQRMSADLFSRVF